MLYLKASEVPIPPVATEKVSECISAAMQLRPGNAVALEMSLPEVIEVQRHLSVEQQLERISWAVRARSKFQVRNGLQMLYIYWPEGALDQGQSEGPAWGEAMLKAAKIAEMYTALEASTALIAPAD